MNDKQHTGKKPTLSSPHPHPWPPPDISADDKWDDPRYQVVPTPTAAIPLEGCAGYAVGFIGGLTRDIFCVWGLTWGKVGLWLVGVLVALQLGYIVMCYRDGNTALASGILSPFVLVLLAYGGCILVVSSIMH